MKGRMTMNKAIKITFLGGDLRQYAAALKLAESDYDIYVFGNEACKNADGIVYSDNVYQAISGAQAVILPLPSSIDGLTLNCAQDKKIMLCDIAYALGEECIVIGGKIPSTFRDSLIMKGIECFDYFESEAFQIKNAYTTAEAAIFVAMEKLVRNIKDSKFAVTGYGRISKQLADILRSFGAKVCVAARKESDLAFAALSGCNTLKLFDHDPRCIDGLACGYDIIFNTVPHKLFDTEFLRKLDRNTLIIELASAPGGIDLQSAGKLNSNVLWASSLPGKYAPQSAGELIAECVVAVLERKVTHK